jgi:L-serine/L-threonine ammonia-lyase
MLHIKTPLIVSPVLSRRLDRPVYLKLDNLQVPGSFKIRGIGATCVNAKSDGFKRLVGSSGGNAGLAMAYAANQLGMPITLFIPKSTPQMMVDLVKVDKRG